MLDCDWSSDVCSSVSVLAGRLRIPALAVSRFEALAGKAPGALVCAVLPGWRDEMFYQLFRRSAQGAVRPAAAPVWATAQEWACAKTELAAQDAVLAEMPVRAEDLLPCAARLLKAKRRPRFEPLYLKPASYELKAAR
jgi:tRNA A37 threonylcarbamoyladenosine modification protein TsaB